MKNVQILLTLALSLTLAGCAVGRHPVGPNYAKPPMNVAPFHNLSSAKAVTSGLPAPKLDTWWTGFDDPVLVTMVQRALEQNLDLAAALERVTQARAAAARGWCSTSAHRRSGSVGDCSTSNWLRIYLVSLATAFLATAEIFGNIRLVRQRAGRLISRAGCAEGKPPLWMNCRPPKPTMSGRESQSPQKLPTPTSKCGNSRHGSQWHSSSLIPTQVF